MSESNPVRAQAAEQPLLRARLVGMGALCVFLLAMAVIVLLSRDGRATTSPARSTTPSNATRTGTGSTPSTTKPAAANLSPITLTGVGGFDPFGDQSENDSSAGASVDGDQTTFWRSETYRSAFVKDGVGLVLDFGATRTPEKVVLSTDTPGFRADIRVGDVATGPFRVASTARLIGTRTTIPLRAVAGRYLLVWIVELQVPGAAHVNEVRVLAAARATG